jgi:membrane-anchored protein YejM (alkaline phosphatase superfamily)
MWILWVVLVIFLGGTLAVSAYQRMLTVVVPLVLLISAVYSAEWLRRLRTPAN